MKRATLVLAAALAIPVAAFGQAAGERKHHRQAAAAGQTAVDERRPAAADAGVSIENMAGSVKVTGWDRGEVHVKGTLAEGAELAMDGNDRRLRIRVEVSHGNPMHAASDLQVFVPAGSRLDVESFSSTVTVTGVSGVVRAETVNGSLTHEGPSSEVQLQSVNGPVRTTRAQERTHVEAVNGEITVRDASGEVAASTVNGTLSVTGGSFGRARLESVGGTIRFEGALSAQATLNVETVSGEVELVLPAGLGADFSVSTFTGTITNELGPAAQKKDDWTPGKELVFTSGKGGARVNVETLSGSVHIRKKQ